MIFKGKLLKKLLITFIIVILIVIGTVSFLFYRYYRLEFRPYLPKIMNILQTTHVLHKEPPKQLLKALAVVGKDKKSIAISNGKLLFNILLLKNEKINLIQLRWAIWSYLLEFHLSDAEMITLWCHLAPYMDGETYKYGLNDSALLRYNKNLDELSIKELFTIITISNWPVRYKNNTLELEERVNELMKKYNEKYGNKGSPVQNTEQAK